MLILFQIPAAKIYNHSRTKWVKNRAGVLPIFISLCIDSPPLSKNRRSPLRRFLLREGDTGSFTLGNLAWDHALPLLSLYVSHGKRAWYISVKKPESGPFSDWVGNNTDDLCCSNWPKCRHPLVVVDFSLHFCLRNEQWIHTRVCYKISAGSVFLNLKNA